MTRFSWTLPVILGVAVLGVFAAGGLTIGFAPMLTLTAIASTVVIFYLLIQTTQA